MANRYWRGGTGTWNATTTTNWSLTSNGAGGASVPTTTTDVIIDQPGPYTVTCNLGGQCLTLTISGANVSFVCTTNVTISGTVFNIAGSTVWSGTANLIFSNSSLCTATTNGVVLTNLQFQVNGAGGVTLGSALNMSAASQINMQTGTLYINGFSCNVGIWSNSGSAVRGMDWGTGGSITLTNTTAAASVLVGASMTNFTLSGTGGFFSNANTTKTYSWGTTGGSAAVAVNLTITGGGSSAQTLTSSGTGSWWKTLDISGVSCAYTSSTINNVITSLVLSSTSAYTSATFGVVITTAGTTITTNGATALWTLTINVPGATWVLNTNVFLGILTLTAGTLDVSSFDLTTGAFVSTNANTRSVAFGSRNIYITGGTAGSSVDLSAMGGFSWTGTGAFVIDSSIGRSALLGSTSGGSYAAAPNITVINGGGLFTLTSTSLLPAWVNNLNYASYTNGTHNAAFVNVGGNLTGPSFAPTTQMRNLTITFGNSATSTFTSNGAQFGSITVNGASTIVSLADALTMTNSSLTGTLFLTAGTLKINGFSCLIPIFSSNNSNTRVLDWGTNGSITANHTTAGTTVLNTATMTNFSWTGTGAFYIPMSITRTIACGTGSTATTANAFNVYINGGVSVPTITSGSWFNTIDFSGATGAPATTLINATNWVSGGGAMNNLTLQMVGTGTIRFNGTTNLAALYINCPGGTTTLQDAGQVAAASTIGVTITAGTLDLNGFSFTTGLFISNNTNARGIKFTSGSTMTLNYGTAATVNVNVADATNFTTTGTGGFSATMSITRTFTFGSTAGGSSTNAPNLTLVSGASIPTLTSGSYFNLLDFGTTTSNPGTTSLNLNGLTLSSGGTYTTLTPTFVGTGTFTSNNKSIPNMTVNTSGTLTLSGLIFVLVTGVGTLTHTQGTIDFNGTILTCATYTSTPGSNTARTLTSTAVNGYIVCTTTWTVTFPAGFTCTSANFTVRLGNNTVPMTFNGGGATYSNVSNLNNNQITTFNDNNNTITTLSALIYPSTINFQAGSTTNVTDIPFLTAATGSPGAYMYSTTPGTQYTISKTSGTVLANYLTVQDSNVTGGAYWDLTTTGTNTNVSNNTGWNGGVVSPVKGQFFSFF